MNKIVKEAVETYYSQPTIIEGPGEKTWGLPGFSITLKTNYMKYFVVLLANSKKYDYYLHFENESDEPYTEREKNILFTALSSVLKKGDRVTTSGGVTPGGISALKNLIIYNFEIEEYISNDQIQWASDRLFNKEKFAAWVKNPKHKNDFKIIDNTKPITKDNTKPVIPVLVKS